MTSKNEAMFACINHPQCNGDVSTYGESCQNCSDRYTPHTRYTSEMEYCILYLGSIKPNYRLLQERFNTIFNSSRSCTAIGIKYRALCRRHSLLTCDEVEEFLEGKVECYDWHEERVDFLLPPDTRSVSVNLVHGIDALFEDFLIPALQLSLVSGYDNEAVWYRILGAGRRIVGDEKLLCDETDFKEMRKLVRQVDDPLVLVRAVTEED